MSTEVNTNIYERAAAMIDLWVGTPYETYLADAIKRDNLDDIYRITCLAEAHAAQNEMEATDAY